MKTLQELLAELDPDQLAAATAERNAVIAAGAGSGKTRVLAARYVYLAVEREIPVDEILALTFTRKAAAEMYARIYGTLRDLDHPRAKDAIADFHRARIDTLDAFCNSIVRSACRRYGVSPDFTIDNDRARDLAESLALPFFLERRASPAVRQLMRRYSFAELPVRLFADTAARHIALSADIDFAGDFQRQRGAVAQRLEETLNAAYAILGGMRSLTGGSGKAWAEIAGLLEKEPDERPDPDDLAALVSFDSWLSSLTGVGNWGATKNEGCLAMKEYLAALKPLESELRALVNFIANGPVILETLGLISEFAELYNRKKRESGILTFADAARMAVDALSSDEELRAAYAAGAKAIMIDEFQDDNELQRDLLFLLAAPPGWKKGLQTEDPPESAQRAPSIPGPRDILPDRLFFVGDEKQSIYRFRGADVSVFRALERDLGDDAMPALGTNYRSETPLIEAFNALFPRVFLNPKLVGEGDFPLYEAMFSPIGSSRATPGLDSGVTVILVPKANFSDGDPGELSPEETEAAEVAERIRSLREEGFRVRGDGKDGSGETRPLEYDDVAILFRTTTRQHLFEKRLRDRGIPYQTESLTGLFADAPINDLYALLRLAVYPRDRAAYAMFLRSPLANLDDETVTIALLHGEAPFSEEASKLLAGGERERFLAAAELWRDARNLADRISAAELVSRIWYRVGYRYAVVADPELHRFAELYDYFFELARQSDERGETLAVFLDRVFALMQSGERVDDLDIPVEKSGGVRLMTVHKSKGLEFPVVFIVNADGTGRAETNADPVYLSREYGLTVNTGASEEAPDATSNWFWERVREEERKKADAELKRLLYVAMTRAEVRLFVTALTDVKAEPTETPRSGAELTPLLQEILDRKDRNAKGRPLRFRSFLELLAIPLSSLGNAAEIPNLRLEEALPRRHDGTGYRGAKPDGADRPGEAFNRRFAELAARVPVVDFPAPKKRRLAVTALAAQREAADTALSAKAAPAQEGDSLDRLLQRLELSPTDFGTYAHREIEARMTGIPFMMGDEIRAEVSTLAERFLESETGKLALGAERRENEFAFLTTWEENGEELVLSGQIDLLFVRDGKAFVVDFKTDRVERPEQHAFQLSVYRKAAEELFGLPVETRLYYLRSGNAVTVL